MDRPQRKFYNEFPRNSPNLSGWPTQDPRFIAPHVISCVVVTVPLAHMERARYEQG
jgi:hypothetical protein